MAQTGEYTIEELRSDERLHEYSTTVHVVEPVTIIIHEFSSMVGPLKVEKKMPRFITLKTATRIIHLACSSVVFEH